MHPFPWVCELAFVAQVPRPLLFVLVLTFVILMSRFVAIVAEDVVSMGAVVGVVGRLLTKATDSNVIFSHSVFFSL